MIYVHTRDGSFIKQIHIGEAARQVFVYLDKMVLKWTGGAFEPENLGAKMNGVSC
jgi:hypothetical protein